MKTYFMLHAFRRLIYPTPSINARRIRQTFEGRNVIITGASHGIGKSLALMLMEAGAQLLLIARSSNELDALCQKARAMGCKAQYVAVDLRDREALAQLCDRLSSEFSATDYLFSNAGKSICRTIGQSKDRLHDYDRTMDVNYRSMVALMLSLQQSLINAHGTMIYTSSVSTLYPAVSGWSAYHASKSAANVWCQTADAELRKHNVRVKIAYMPLVHTAMSDVNPDYRNLPGYTAEEAAQLLLQLAMNRSSEYMPWWARLTRHLAHLFSPLINRYL